jgi:GNAT superfamily N-acetyltransferase
MAIEITVRPAVPGDAGTLVEFNREMALETEGKELDPDHLRSGVDALFAEPHRGAYRVAEIDGRVVGGLMLTYEWSDWRNADFWWIQSVYVRPEHRRRGVFRALYASVGAEAREAERVCGLRLYVERENEAAQQVYRAVGMRESVYRLFEHEW